MINNIAFSLLCFLAVVTLLTLYRHRFFKNRNIQLFRALFPSWRFFEDSGRVPILYWRYSKDRSSLGDWVPTLKCRKRHWWHLFLNPQGNYQFACKTLLHQLVSDINDLESEFDQDAVKRLISFELVKNLVIYELSRSFKNSGPLHFQFKVTATPSELTKGATDDILVSETYEAPL